MREYIATLDDVAFGAASEVTPKFVSPSDPAAQREQVFDELYNLRVPGIASTMGKQEMLLRFVDWQAEHEDAIAGKSEQPIIETVVDGLPARRILKIAPPKTISGLAFSPHGIPQPRGTACYATVYCGAACLSGAA